MNICRRVMPGMLLGCIFTIALSGCGTSENSAGSGAGELANSQVPSSAPQSAAPTSAPTVSEITGNWKIKQGTNPDGSKYTGSVKITPAADLYALSWTTPTQTFSGWAFYESGHLFVGWGNQASTYGVVIYKIGKDGTLDGRWSTSDYKGKTGKESGTGGTPGKVQGDYKVVGTNPDGGKAYSGTLAIRQVGDVYQLAWAVGSSYKGIGLRSGDWLVAGWGQQGAYGVVDYTVQGNTLNGRWATPDSTKVGAEILNRN